MSQLAPNAAYWQIEDQLDAVGQKYRMIRIVRGFLLWLTTGILLTAAATLGAHLLGHGRATGAIAMVWAAALFITALVWIVRPLLLHPKPLEVARFVESRLEGLHNGLTNSVLLAKAGDLQENPWLPVIFEEILSASRNKSLDEAVKLADLKPLSLRLAGALLPVLLLAGFRPGMFMHGWQQMFSPGTFVPQTMGVMEIVQVLPGDVTLVTGQPLEVTVVARGPQMPDAKVIFSEKFAAASVIATAAGDGTLRYAHRLEHIEQTMKYRVEVGSTQSPWYTVTVVKQIKLQELTLKITAPAYTRQAARVFVLKPADIEKTPVTALEGSQVELTIHTDVPTNGAMLQVGDGAPLAMQVEQAGLSFSGHFTAMQDSPLAVLLTEGAGQIVARLPEQTFIIRVTRDAPPAIEMRWPTQDVSVPPPTALTIKALLKDDIGVSAYRVLMSTASDAPLAPVTEFKYPDAQAVQELAFTLPLDNKLRVHGQAIKVQVETTDNRDLQSILKDAGPQTVSSPIYEIKFRDEDQIRKEEKEKSDKLRARLMEMLKTQQALHEQAVALKPAEKQSLGKIGAGQSELRNVMQRTAETFEFEEQTRIIQKTLLIMSHGAAQEAIDLCVTIGGASSIKQVTTLNGDLQTRQRRIISTLESLLALLNAMPEATTQPTAKQSGDLPNKKEELTKLNEALKEFMKQEQKILDQTANLAKKPVDNWDDKDKKLLEDLLMSQEKMDAFMQQKISDFSKLSEQDMSNSSLLKELMQVYSEVTMAKDALKKKATEIAVSLEESGLEMAKEISSNLEKWLMDKPDREAWKMEDPVGKTDTPMAELPKELEDMVGELMEQQEDLFEEMEDTNSNWADSLDKGAGWDAADGPIANMSAKGVTGNQLPNNNEMNGRAGEGRSGKSQGEFVDETAQGKGGRNTPTRLDPTPFQQGQIKDQSKDPVGGATGGGKISGQGGQGLEGPVPPKMKQEMERLAQKQAELRNNAERLNLQYQLGRYDNFKLLESIAMMRRVESDLKANRYQTAMRRKDILLDAMDTSHMLLGGQLHVQQDTSPTTSQKMQEQINDAMKGELPAQWSEALKEYYKKLATE